MGASESAGRPVVVTLQCGGCQGEVGRAVLPPFPPFSSLGFELRTLLKPLLKYAARKLPAIQPAVQCWTDDRDGASDTIAQLVTEAWRRAILCPRCHAAGVILSALPAGEFVAYRVLPARPEMES